MSRRVLGGCYFCDQWYIIHACCCCCTWNFTTQHPILTLYFNSCFLPLRSSSPKMDKRSAHPVWISEMTFSILCLRLVGHRRLQLSLLAWFSEYLFICVRWNKILNVRIPLEKSMQMTREWGRLKDFLILAIGRNEQYELNIWIEPNTVRHIAQLPVNTWGKK